MDNIPQDTPQKQCTSCKQWKPATTEYFCVAKRYRYGVNSQCKECVAANRGLRKSARPCDNEGNIQCTKCREWKPATTDFFYAIGNYSSLAGECKDCMSKDALRYDQKKPKKYRHLKPGATTKVCPKCKIEKPLGDFWKVQSRNGYYARCIACERNYAPPDVEQKPLFVLTKICKECKQEKSADEFYQRKDKSLDRLDFICKKCNNERSHRNRQKKLDERREHDHKYYEAKRQVILSKNREKREETPHRSPYLMAIAEWTRRDQAMKAGVLVEKVSYPRIFERDKNFCYICEGDILPEHRIAFDHVIPLIKNGSHTEDNIRLAHYVCNNRKGSRLVSEMTPFQRRGM